MDNSNLDYEGQEKVAILIDGAFYLDRAKSLFGSKSPDLNDPLLTKTTK